MKRVFLFGAICVLCSSQMWAATETPDCGQEGQAFTASMSEGRKSAFAALIRCVRETPLEKLPNAGYQVLFDAYKSETDAFLRETEFIGLTLMSIAPKITPIG